MPTVLRGDGAADQTRRGGGRVVEQTQHGGRTAVSFLYRLVMVPRSSTGVSAMGSLVRILGRSRYVVNLRPDEQAKVTKAFPIRPGETIQVMLDDSPFKTLTQGIVFTDKRIYWNLAKAHQELRNAGTLISTRGPGSVAAADLQGASVFARNTSAGMVVHLIDGDTRIRLTLAWFENDETVKILFYYYLSKFAGVYNPDHEANGERYTRYLREHKGKSISVIPLVYDIFNHAIIGVLLLNLIIPRLTGGRGFAGYERILFFSVAVKLLGILFRYRKSALMNSLLMTVLACSFVLPGIFPRIDTPYMVLGYAGLSTLFSVFDFDRIFTYLIFALAIVSAVVLFLQLFWLGPLF
jgi:hypothetical protein